MTPMQRTGLCKRCAALALVLTLCSLPPAALSADASYGTVTANALNLRAAPDTASKVLTSFPSGTWVQVLETAGSWHKVRIDSWVGYMSANYVSLSNVTKVTDAKVSGAAGYINLRASASINAPVLATYPNGAAVKILAHTGGFYQVQVGNLTGYMADYLVRLDDVKVLTYAVIRTANGGNLNMRAAPSMAARVVQSFKPGQQVEVLQRGDGWHQVRVAGVTGYMRAEFLSIGGGTASSGKYGIVNNPRPTQVLNLRELPSLNARVLAYYYNGKQVEILSSSGDWHRVRVNGTTGYMLKRFVLLLDAPAPATPFAARLKNPNGGSIVNFRESPGLNTRILAYHPVGKTVTVLGYYNADWARVSIDSLTGYVSSYFLAY